MISSGHLRDAIGLKGLDSINEKVHELEKTLNKSVSYSRGRNTILEPEFFKPYFQTSKRKRVLPFSRKIVSCGNNKGGVGKTVTAAMIAYKLAQLGYKVLCIDSDPQANLTTYLLGENYQADYSLYNYFKGECSEKDLVVKVSDYLSIVPGSLDNDFITEVVSAVALPNALVKKVIEKTDAEIVLIDTNPTLSDMNLAIHSITDMLITVINNDNDSIKGLGNVLSKTEILGYQGLHKVVLNKFDGRETMSEVASKLGRILSQYGSEIDISQSKIRIDTALKKAQVNVNGAINQIELNSKCQQDFLKLAIELIADFSFMDNEGASE